MTSSSDTIAFEILVREHHRALLAYGRSLYLTAGQWLAEGRVEDLVQDSLVVAYQNLHRFDPQRNFRSWVCGIMRNRFLKLARNREVVVSPEVMQDVEAYQRRWQAVAAGQAGEKGDLLEALHHCLGRLQQPLRGTIELCYLQGCSLAEIAEQASSSVDAIKKRLQRGRELLQRCLAGEGFSGTTGDVL